MKKKVTSISVELGDLSPEFAKELLENLGRLSDGYRLSRLRELSGVEPARAADFAGITTKTLWSAEIGNSLLEPYIFTQLKCYYLSRFFDKLSIHLRSWIVPRIEKG